MTQFFQQQSRALCLVDPSKLFQNPKRALRYGYQDRRSLNNYYICITDLIDLVEGNQKWLKDLEKQFKFFEKITHFSMLHKKFRKISQKNMCCSWQDLESIVHHLLDRKSFNLDQKKEILHMCRLPEKDVLCRAEDIIIKRLDQNLPGVFIRNVGVEFYRLDCVWKSIMGTDINLAIEIDEMDHKYYNTCDDEERTSTIKRHGYNIFRISVSRRKLIHVPYLDDIVKDIIEQGIKLRDKKLKETDKNEPKKTSRRFERTTEKRSRSWRSYN